MEAKAPRAICAGGGGASPCPRREGDGIQTVAGGVQPEGRHLQDFADVAPYCLSFRVGTPCPGPSPRPTHSPSLSSLAGVLFPACLSLPRHFGLVGLPDQSPHCARLHGFRVLEWALPPLPPAVQAVPTHLPVLVCCVCEGVLYSLSTGLMISFHVYQLSITTSVAVRNRPYTGAGGFGARANPLCILPCRYLQHCPGATPPGLCLCKVWSQPWCVDPGRCVEVIWGTWVLGLT